MYIQPNSTIRILQGVPINGNYVNTLYFANSTAQQTWFQDKTKYVRDGMTYQRSTESSIRVEIPSELLFDCNYLMFQNTSYGTKWFYAFIKDVEYKNNEVSIIHYEIDVMQTWYFDYSMMECFIERMHTLTDKAGDNREPENLEQGGYVMAEHTNTKSGESRSAMSVVVLASFNKSFEDSSGQSQSTSPNLFNGMYSGLSVIAMTEMGETLETYSYLNPKVIPFFEKVASEDKADGIVAVYMMPTAFAKDTASYDPVVDRGSIIFENLFTQPTAVNGYAPTNKKLLTSPYNKFVVTDGLGASVEYEFENFNGGIPVFKIVGLASGKPEIMLAPVQYKGVAVNFSESITINNLPTVAYSTDSYKAWLAQNSISMGFGATTGIASTALSALALTNPATMPLGIAGIGVSLASSVGNAMSQVHSARIQPNRVGGSQSSGSTLVYTGDYGFRFYTASLREEFAKRIDQHFNMFGYKVNTVGRPARKQRPYYTYLKLKGDTVVGSIPSKDLQRVNDILNNGVTFWDIVACESVNRTVGDYSLLDNRVPLADRTGWVN